MVKTVGIVGAGALGILYGLQFCKKAGKENIYFIADGDRVARYKKDGIIANGTVCDFQYVEGAKAPQVDLLIFTVKDYDLDDAMNLARRAMGKNTIVMSFLNGVTSEEKIKEFMNPNRLIYCTVQGMDATKTGNKLVYEKTGDMTIEGRNEASDEIEEFLDRMGIKYREVEDIKHHMWSKWMLNVGVNQVCAAYGLTYGGVQFHGIFREMMISAMEEARQCACSEGVHLTEEERDDWVVIVDSLSSDGEPSMRQDTREGRETEVQLFAGRVIELAEKHGLETPRNQFLYSALTGELEQPTPYRHKAHYYETDQMGIVHHSNYVRWMEEARVDYLDKVGVPFRAMEELGIASPVIGVNCEYKHSVQFDTTVTIEVKVSEYGGVKLGFDYNIWNDRTGQLSTVCHSVHCFTGIGGRPLSLKKKFPQLHKLLKAALNIEDTQNK